MIDRILDSIIQDGGQHTGHQSSVNIGRQGLRGDFYFDITGFACTEASLCGNTFEQREQLRALNAEGQALPVLHGH